MTLSEYAQLIKEMRQAQKAYFQTRDRAILDKSKQLEKRVDAETAKILDNQTRLL